MALGNLHIVSGVCLLFILLLAGCGQPVRLENSGIEIRRNLFGTITITTPSGASIAVEHMNFAFDESYLAGRISSGGGAEKRFFLMNILTGMMLYFNTSEDIDKELVRLGYRPMWEQTLTDFESLGMRLGGKNKGKLQKQGFPAAGETVK